MFDFSDHPALATRLRHLHDFLVRLNDVPGLSAAERARRWQRKLFEDAPLVASEIAKLPPEARPEDASRMFWDMQQKAAIEAARHTGRL